VEHVEDAVKRGATVVTKQRPTPSRGAFFNPVVLADAPQDCVGVEYPRISPDETPQLLTDEETFGPVAALIKFKTEDEVIVCIVPAGQGKRADLVDRTWQMTQILAWQGGCEASD
jgi:acyl-CoA reductase-like NAD-dependent aldehyde dehydrogenase